MSEHERSRVVAGNADKQHLLLVESVADKHAIRLELLGGKRLKGARVEFPLPTITPPTWRLIRQDLTQRGNVDLIPGPWQGQTFGYIKQIFVEALRRLGLEYIHNPSRGLGHQGILNLEEVFGRFFGYDLLRSSQLTAEDTDAFVALLLSYEELDFYVPPILYQPVLS